MSILAEMRNRRKQRGLFGIIAGLRLAGKSTLAGTLPGKTVMLQAAIKETGSDTAQQLAIKNGNVLEILTFNSVAELLAALRELSATAVDNIYIDGISAITELRYEEPDVQLALGSPKGPWGAFDMIKHTMHQTIEAAKRVAEENGKNVFVTLAMDAELNEAKQLVALNPVTKGKAVLSEIKKYGNAVLIPTFRMGEDGEIIRELITKNTGPFSARIDSLLDADNPGIMPADLSLVLKLVQEKT